MYCSKCGKEVASGSRFCEVCGYPTSTRAQVRIPLRDEARLEAFTERMQGLMWKAGSSPLLVVAGVVGIFFFLINIIRKVEAITILVKDMQFVGVYNIASFGFTLIDAINCVIVLLISIGLITIYGHSKKQLNNVVGYKLTKISIYAFISEMQIVLLLFMASFGAFCVTYERILQKINLYSEMSYGGVDDINIRASLLSSIIEQDGSFDNVYSRALLKGLVNISGGHNWVINVFLFLVAMCLLLMFIFITSVEAKASKNYEYVYRTFVKKEAKAITKVHRSPMVLMQMLVLVAPLSFLQWTSPLDFELRVSTIGVAILFLFVLFIELIFASLVRGRGIIKKDK